MKASKARSVAVEAQYASITKKIESACKDGREGYEYKHGLLFDEVVMKLIEDGFLVIRNYVKNNAIISWVSMVDENELDNVLRCIVPHIDEHGDISDDLVRELDFFAPLDVIPTYEMLEAYMLEAESDGCCICCCKCDDEECDDEECCEEERSDELEGAVTTEPETIEPEVIESEPTESEALESENVEIEILPEVETTSEPVVEVVPEVESTSDPVVEIVPTVEEPEKE